MQGALRSMTPSTSQQRVHRAFYFLGVVGSEMLLFIAEKRIDNSSSRHKRYKHEDKLIVHGDKIDICKSYRSPHDFLIMYNALHACAHDATFTSAELCETNVAMYSIEFSRTLQYSFIRSDRYAILT